MKKMFARNALEVCERTLVAIAAVFALFPMWQYYSEREDRRLDRAANLILAHETCLNFTYKDVFSATPLPESSITEEEILEREIARRGYPIVEVPPDLAATLDPEIVVAIEQHRKQMNALIELELTTPIDLSSFPKAQLPDDVEAQLQADLRQMTEERMREVAGAYGQACETVANLVQIKA